MEGIIRSTNTSSTSEVEEQEKEVIIPGENPQAGTTQADTQEEKTLVSKRLIHKKAKLQEIQKSRIQGTQMKEQYQIYLIAR